MPPRRTGSSNAEPASEVRPSRYRKSKTIPHHPSVDKPNLAEPNTGRKPGQRNVLPAFVQNVHAVFEIEFVAQSLPLELERCLGRGASAMSAAICFISEWTRPFEAMSSRSPSWYG